MAQKRTILLKVGNKQIAIKEKKPDVSLLEGVLYLICIALMVIYAWIMLKVPETSKQTIAFIIETYIILAMAMIVSRTVRFDQEIGKYWKMIYQMIGTFGAFALGIHAFSYIDSGPMMIIIASGLSSYGAVMVAANYWLFSPFWDAQTVIKKNQDLIKEDMLKALADNIVVLPGWHDLNAHQDHGISIDQVRHAAAEWLLKSIDLEPLFKLTQLRWKKIVPVTQTIIAWHQGHIDYLFGQIAISCDEGVIKAEITYPHNPSFCLRIRTNDAGEVRIEREDYSPPVSRIPGCKSPELIRYSGRRTLKFGAEQTAAEKAQTILQAISEVLDKAEEFVKYLRLARILCQGQSFASVNSATGLEKIAAMKERPTNGHPYHFLLSYLGDDPDKRVGEYSPILICSSLWPLVGFTFSFAGNGKAIKPEKVAQDIVSLLGQKKLGPAGLIWLGDSDAQPVPANKY